jgi:hypothetical protein
VKIVVRTVEGVFGFHVSPVIVNEGVLHDGINPRLEIRVLSEFVSVGERFQKRFLKQVLCFFMIGS